jgi:hypothetical protein
MNRYGLETVEFAFLAAISSIQIWVFSANARSDYGKSTGSTASLSTNSRKAASSTDQVRDHDGYVKADLGCCGRVGSFKVKILCFSCGKTYSLFQRRGSDQMTNTSDQIDATMSIDQSSKTEDIVDGVVML